MNVGIQYMYSLLTLMQKLAQIWVKLLQAVISHSRNHIPAHGRSQQRAQGAEHTYILRVFGVLKKL